MRLLSLTALLLACGQKPEPQVCITPCGTVVLRSTMYCEDFKLLERELAARLAPTLPQACESWRGVTAWGHDGSSSVLRGQLVAGWAECHLARFHFHNGYEMWRRPWHTAYAHELIHIAQGCESPTPPGGAPGDHADWEYRGYFQTLSDTAEALDRGSP